MARFYFLKKVPLMASLQDDEVAKICGVLDVCDYDQGDAIVTQVNNNNNNRNNNNNSQQ
jgi:signal-transduction protein with cAMP-binding, CBS, and nucleotidyltransferase domain